MHINGLVHKRVRHGESLATTDALYPVARAGVLDDARFTLSYSPIVDELGAVGGVLLTVFETAARRRAESAMADELRAMVRLQTLSSHLVGTTQLPLLLEEILDAAIELHDADFGSIQLYDPATKTLKIAAQRGFGPEFLEHFAVVDSTEASVYGMALARRGRVDIEDVEREPSHAPSLAVARDAGYRGVQATPMYDRDGELLGMLATHFRTPRRLSEHEVRVTDVLAHLAGATIARARAEAALHEREARRAFLLALSDAIRSLENPEAVKAAAARVLGERLSANRVFYAEVDGDDWLVEGRFEQGVRPIPPGRYGAEVYGRFVIDAFRAGRRVVFGDVRSDPAFSPAERDATLALEIVSAVGVPLVKAGRLVAVLVVQCAAARDWSEEEIALVDETGERTWAAVEHARAEVAARAGEARYRTLFESIDEGFCVIELLFENGSPVDYRFLEANPAFIKQTGLVDAVGRTMRELVPAHETHWFDIYGKVALTGEPIRFEAPAAGLGRFYDVYAFRVGEPRANRVAILFNDITERGRTESALRESEARARTLAELAPALLWEADSTGRVVSLNPRWREYTGQTLEEVQRGAWLEAIHSDDRPQTERIVIEAFATGRPLEVEHRVRRHDGVHRWFLARQLPVLDERGRVTRWLGAAIDIHAQRMALEEAERLAAARARERDALRRQLLEAEEAERRHLARELHDEAGQRLTALGLGLRALSDVAAPGSETDRRATELRAIAAELGRELHALALRLRPRALDDFGLESALAAYAEEWSHQSGIASAVHAAAAADRLPASVESTVYRVVQEALANVARHSEASHASVVIERRNGQVVAVIEDDGRGFDPSLLQTPVASTGKRERAEPGLGLLAIRERVALLGGTVELESAEGAGTSLFVRIPIDPMSADER